jgi:DNA-binding NtrC family response regulator
MVRASAPIDGLVGTSPPMLELFDAVRRVGEWELPTLILGETGTGKELIAQALHRSSSRRRRRLVAVNCGAIDSGTALSTLFGHERGAFTGASGRRRGAFREADGGTLFLDEIGELSLDMQVALLRALETGQVTPVGGDLPETVDFRLIAATHRDLSAEMLNGKFREDLYYRLAVTVVRVPALRSRRDDIHDLCRHFIAQAAPGRGLRMSPGALRALESHTWPGNVRELRNAVLRAVVATDGDTILREHLALPGQLPLFWDPPRTEALPLTPARPRAEVQRGELLTALQKTSGNRTLAAMDLGISRSTLYARLKRLGLK